MMQSDVKRASSPISAAALLLAAAVLLAISGGARAAAAVGRTVFASGAPQAVDAAGAARALKRGDEVFQGDRLETPNGSRLQVSFVDGAFISVQPDSQYEITQYQYSGKPDGTEHATYSLLKGGVRAVTGLIGKKNPDAYKVQTPVATIGIRGTGHNTRYCHGDCPGRPDGLYHNTWEGITFVTNDVDTKDVPSGSGVFVVAIDKPIVYLDQPSGATAVDTGNSKEKDQKRQEDQGSAFVAGDQRNPEGDQTVVPAASSTVSAGLNLAGIGPRDNQSSNLPNFVDASGVSVFVRDSDKVLVGLMLFHEHEDSSGADHMTLATTDPDAIRGGNDAASVSAAESLLALADPQLFTLLQEKPAQVADQFIGDDGFGWFRWTDGRALVAPEDPHGPPHVLDLSGDQSFHFIFGMPVATLPASGLAEYDFMGGTQSTSLSGATIGKGVTDGSIFIDFGNDQGSLSMVVDHDSVQYQVVGALGIDRGSSGFGLIGQNILATTALSPVGGPTSECYPSCAVSIDGGFAGPATGSGPPQHIGLAYQIEVSDPIIGVAGFQYTASAPAARAGH